MSENETKYLIQELSRKPKRIYHVMGTTFLHDRDKNSIKKCQLNSTVRITRLRYGDVISFNSNRNECQGSSWGGKRSGCVRLKTSPTTASRLSIERGILDVSQFHRSPRPISVTAFTLLIYIKLPPSMSRLSS
jgi:hypothetical protein